MEYNREPSKSFRLVNVTSQSKFVLVLHLPLPVTEVNMYVMCQVNLVLVGTVITGLIWCFLQHAVRALILARSQIPESHPACTATLSKVGPVESRIPKCNVFFY
jgi:hypothetical protein